jgi:tetratricopeptide (TPR) repeat protein
MRRFHFFLLSAAIAGIAIGAGDARALYQRTEYRAVLDLLAPAARQSQPEALLLSGQAAFQLEDYKTAEELLARAAEVDPKSSVAQHWLGKAYGRRAENSNFFAAAGLATRCVRAFEKAVELDPKNKEAWSDLLEYYLSAPGFMGGGMERAVRAATRIGELDPVEKHYALARLAEKKKDYTAVEKSLRQALELAPKDAGRAIDVAKFLARRGRWEEAEAMFERAEQLQPGAPKIRFARAQSLIEAKRKPEEARRLFEAYLKSALTPDDPSKPEAQRLLNKLTL